MAFEWCRRRAQVFAIALGAAIAVGVLGSTAVARAQQEPTASDKDTARRLMDEGDVHFEAKRYEEALRAYRAADDIMGVPTTSYEVGKASEAVGKLVEARDAYLKVLRYPKRDNEPSVFGTARDKSEERARSLAPRIPTLTVRIEGADEATDLQLLIDGKPVKAAGRALPRSVNPGTRTVEVRAAGYKPATATVSLDEGQNEEIELALERAAPGEKIPPPIPPVPQPPPAPEEPGDEEHFPIAATLGFGIGAAGLVVGTITGALSLAKAGDLDESCGDDKLCPADQQETLDDAELLANVSNVGFAVGGAGVIFGLIAVFTFDAPSGRGARVEPVVGPSWLGVRGRF